MSEMQYIVTGMPRSGSTVTWQILDHIVRYDQPESGLLRSHGFIELEDDFTVFACYRDFRDVIMSFAKIYNLTIPAVVKHSAWTMPIQGLTRQKKEYWDHPRCHFIKYEDYFPNKIAELAEYIYEVLGLMPQKSCKDMRYQTEAICRDLAKEFSLENAKKMSDKYKDFTKIDPKSMIHGNHVTADGKIGKWKDLTSPSDIGALQSIKPNLKEFGYED